MGFFSSRRAEDNENYVTTMVGVNEKSVVQVIRSRFYGKQKGKEREDNSTSFPAQPSQNASNRIPSTNHVTVAPPTTPAPRTVRIHIDKSLPSTPSRRKFTMDSPPSPSQTQRIREREPSTKGHVKSSSIVSRPGIDNASVTLAQRLNDLAVANSDGLLNDEEYRLLRQDLFERFSGNAVVPTETPVVPVIRPRPNQPTGPSSPDGRPVSRPLSNFQVQLPRPVSITSRNSLKSGVADLFRKSSSRRNTTASKETSDTSSIWSAVSSNSKTFRLPRDLSKKSSNSSIRTTASVPQTDSMSLSSRKVGVGSGSSYSDNHSHFSPSGSRSAAGSIRRLATPPSSFPSRVKGQDNKYAHMINVFEDDDLKTTKDIQAEIMSVEAEVKRLMDAFNGLEMTTQARLQRHQGRPTLKTADANKNEPTWTPTSDWRRRFHADNDSNSVHSATSTGTSPSMARSMYSARKVIRQKTSLNASLALGSASRPSSLHRKNSSSSFASQERRAAAKAVLAPPVPAIPSVYANQGVVANGSNLSLSRSTRGVHTTIPENETMSVSEPVEVEEEPDHEIEDIRRRREEVQLRYEARLEYLRAKLKGAQLHEKLMKK